MPSLCASSIMVWSVKATNPGLAGSPGLPVAVAEDETIPAPMECAAWDTWAPTEGPVKESNLRPASHGEVVLLGPTAVELKRE